MAETVAFQRPPRGMRLAGASLALLVLLVAALWLLPSLLDWNRYRATIASFAAGQLGRPVRIDGPISVVLLPTPLLIAGDVSLGDRGDGITLTAPTLRLRLALPPLLLGYVVPRALILSRAAITLPWPLPPAALATDRPAWLSASSARIEGARLTIGAMRLTDLNADLAAGPPDTGGFVITGSAHALGQRWRVTTRLATPDIAGAVPVEATLDADEHPPNTLPTDIAAHFIGTLSQAGALTGRLTAHAADLSRLLPAPPIAASADGTLSLGQGPAQAQLALTLAGVPVTAHLQPDPRHPGQVLSLSTGTLDLDAWDKALSRLRAARTSTPMLRLPWPVSLDLTADAMRLRGGLIRGVHAVLDVEPDQAALRTATALLPGDAQLTLTGTLAESAALTLSADWTLDAPQLHATLRWLADCGLRLGTDLPPDVLRQAKLAGHITATSARADIDRLTGTVDQSKLNGQIGVDTATGAIDAALTLDRLEADDWLPQGALPHWPALSHALSAFALTLKLTAAEVTFRGATITALMLDAATNAGGLAINSVQADLDGLHAHLSGTIAGDGQVTDGALDLGAPHGTALARNLPAWASFTDYLWSGPVRLQATANGPMDALITSVGVDLADARLEAHPLVNLATHVWKAQLTLRHPGAPRLLAALGLPKSRDWLGEGSLSLLAQLSGTPGQWCLDSFDLTAATLHATGDLQLARQADATPMLTGHIAADTLPLPVFAPHATAPIPLTWLSALNAKLDLTSATVAVGDSDLLHSAHANLILTAGVLKLDSLKATLGGGTITGAATLDTTATPPLLAAEAQIAGATLSAPLFATALDIAAGRIDARLDLSARGHSPASLLASLSGTAHLTASLGSVAGLDLPAAHLAADPAALTQSLSAGMTQFDRLQADATVSDATATLANAGFAGPAGATEWSGTIDLQSAVLNLLARLPDQRSLRLTGPATSPHRAIGAQLPSQPR
jgi:hypothetical protein